MISVKIPNGRISGHEIKELIQLGVEQIELAVYADGQGKLTIGDHTGSGHSNNISLNDFLRFVAAEQLEFSVILNLKESNLENRAAACAKDWLVGSKVNYAGKIIPTNLSPWDCQRVYYHVDNCLPNYYHLEKIKKTHLDVIHYFMRKYKVKTLRIHEKGLTDDVIEWAAENELTLAVYGVDSLTEAELLCQKGVGQVSITDVSRLTKMHQT